MTTTAQVPLSADEWLSALADIGFYMTTRTADEILDWALSDVRVLAIKGVPCGGKTALAESVVRVLDGGSLGDQHKRVMRLTYSPDLKFGDLFYESNGAIRSLAARIAREAGKSPEEVERAAQSPDLMDDGMPLTALRDPAYRFVIIDGYNGPLDDPEADKALADFIAERRVHLPEPGGDVARRPGEELRVLVTFSSSADERDLARGEFYEALRHYAVWVEMSEADRAHCLHILARVAPKLDREVIRELVIFIDHFNELPENNHRVTLGELIEVAEALEEIGARSLTARLIEHHLHSMIAKTHRSSVLLDEHAARILEGIREGNIR